MLYIIYNILYVYILYIYTGMEVMNILGSLTR